MVRKIMSESMTIESKYAILYKTCLTPPFVMCKNPFVQMSCKCSLCTIIFCYCSIRTAGELESDQTKIVLIQSVKIR